MRKKQSNNKTTLCPFLEENCLKLKCEIYNTVLDRCELGLLDYNFISIDDCHETATRIRNANKRI